MVSSSSLLEQKETQRASAPSNSMTQGLQVSILRLWRWSPAVLAAALVGLTCLKAITTVDMTWDTLSYHMPFAALRAGLMTPWQFQRGPVEIDTLTAFYQGFPVLGDLLQGWMWRLSGRAEAINLLGIMSMTALVGYLKWAFRISAPWSFIGLFAIPQVQSAAAGGYIDVNASAALTILMLSICDLWANPHKFRSPARWIILFLGAFVAANSKLQTSLFVCFALPLVIPPTWRLLREQLANRRQIVGVALLQTCAALLILVNLVKNFILYHNPVFPIDLRIAGIHFSGAVKENWLSAGPMHHLPQFVQWLLSILEFHALDGREIPYTNGMGNVSITSLGFEMGGFFSALVVGGVGFFILCVWLRRDRLSICFAAMLFYFTIMVALFPNSLILRYSLFWMMFLVTSCLILLRRHSLTLYLQSYKVVLFASLIFVTSVTGGIYFLPIGGKTMQEFVDSTGADKILRRIVVPGDVICLGMAWQGVGKFDNRFTIIFAPVFHKALASERAFAIKEGFCDGHKTITSLND